MLPGIVRKEVLDIAKALEIDAQEVPVGIDELLDADEVLLTNTMMQVMPVVRIEKHDIAEGRVGPIAKKLFEEYRNRVKKECGDK